MPSPSSCAESSVSNWSWKASRLAKALPLKKENQSELPSTFLASAHELSRKMSDEGEHGPASARSHHPLSHRHALRSRCAVRPATSSERVIWAPRATSIPSECTALHASCSGLIEASTADWHASLLQGLSETWRPSAPSDPSARICP